jgi:PilZ domain-containing protein
MPTESESKSRRCERRPARLALVLILDPMGKRTEKRTFTFDLSPYGAGVESGAALKPGQIVELIPYEGPQYSVRTRVIWVGEANSDRGGKAGLEFLASASQSV